MEKTTTGDEFIITFHESDESWDVYNERTEHLYRVECRNEKWQCNCPHWYHRLRKTGGACKHIDVVKQQLAKEDH